MLLYHLYIVNTWRKVTLELLKDIPHETIIVNVNYDLRYAYKLPFVWLWLRMKFPRIKKIFFTANHAAISEVLGFEKFRNYLRKYKKPIHILTYMHSKGVTRVGQKSVDDWRELMRYFIIDRMELCVQAFERGYKLYGCNIYVSPENGQHSFKYAPYIFRGNFVSVNYPLLKDEILTMEPAQDYYGIEGYWGNLCDISEAFCCHDSGIRHYEQEYPEHYYKTNIAKIENGK